MMKYDKGKWYGFYDYIYGEFTIINISGTAIGFLAKCVGDDLFELYDTNYLFHDCKYIYCSRHFIESKLYGTKQLVEFKDDYKKSAQLEKYLTLYKYPDILEIVRSIEYGRI